MLHRMLPFLLVALIPLAAFGQEPSNTGGEAPVEKPASNSKTGSDGLTESERTLLHAAEQIADDIAAIRGLEVKVPVKKGIKKRDELRAVLMQKLAEDVSDADIEAEAALFKRLGVIPADMDYKKILLDILTEQIAGFYDQTSKELYIMEGIPFDLQKPAMAHELFHAIQDQHFDILSMQEPFSTIENSDFALARSALLEGDATILMFDYSLYESKTLPQPGQTSLVDIPFAANMLINLEFNDLSSMEQLAGTFGGADFNVGDSALARAPAIFRESLVFPYFAGMRFIVMARTQRTWKDVDRIYENPPVSTEQILHPEKYFAGDDPEHLSFRSAPALEGWEPIYDSVIGEFQLLQFLKAHSAPGVDSGKAAAGWDGDRVHAFQHPDGRTAVVFVSSWDSIGEAQEFYEAAVATSVARYPDVAPQQSVGEHGQSTCWALNNGEASERLYIEQWGDLVLYIEGTPSELDENGKELNPATHQLRTLAWKTLERQPFREHMAEALAAKEKQDGKPSKK